MFYFKCENTAHASILIFAVHTKWYMLLSIQISCLFQRYSVVLLFREWTAYMFSVAMTQAPGLQHFTRWFTVMLLQNGEWHITAKHLHISVEKVLCDTNKNSTKHLNKLLLTKEKHLSFSTELDNFNMHYYKETIFVGKQMLLHHLQFYENRNMETIINIIHLNCL